MIKEYLLWTPEEYKAIIDYKGDGYKIMNGILSSEVTKRETQGVIPKTSQDFRRDVESIILVYSAIKKHYNLHGRSKYNKILFRGTREGRNEDTFLSTSNSVLTALDFVLHKDGGLLLAINSGDVPWIDLDSVLPFGDRGDEPEILFLPSSIEDSEEISLEEVFKMAQEQGERIPYPQGKLKRFSAAKCEKVNLKELDYSSEKTNFTIDDLLEMFEQYKKDIEKIRSAEKESAEYVEAYTRVVQFKKDCSTFIHQKFYEINQEVKNQMNLEQSEIHLSHQYDMKNVWIGNTGIMYHIMDRENGWEYYFKPAISKGGEARPYRADIQEAAYCVQQIINPEASVKCNRIEINGMYGAIQEKVAIDEKATKSFIEFFDEGKGELSQEIIDQIIDEYLVDFCLCNYDAHARNFIIDKNGRLRGIDKEQSFRYIREDNQKFTEEEQPYRNIRDDGKRDVMMFTRNYNEDYGENPTIYTTLFEHMVQGKIPYQILDRLRYRASRLSQFPDEQYKKIFEQYAYGKSKTPKEAEELLSNILIRKENIMDNVEKLMSDILSEKEKYLAKEKRLLDSAVKATEEVIRTSLMSEQVRTIKNIERERTNQMGIPKDKREK